MRGNFSCLTWSLTWRVGGGSGWRGPTLPRPRGDCTNISWIRNHNLGKNLVKNVVKTWLKTWFKTWLNDVRLERNFRGSAPTFRGSETLIKQA